MRFSILVAVLALSACKGGDRAKSAAPTPEREVVVGTPGSATAGSGEGGTRTGGPGPSGSLDQGSSRPLDHRGAPVTDDVGQVVAVGSLDHSLIRREIKKRLAAVNTCYAQAVEAKPTLEGAIVAEFTIKPDGRVATAKASGLDDGLGRCVASVIEQITFPRPKNGGDVRVKYPFQFRQQAAVAGSNAGSGSGV